MSFGDPWGTPFYSGGGVSSLVPSQFEFAIAGRVYMIDTRQGSGVTVGDIPVQRAQADTNNNPSEATLSTEGLWRRTLLSWHKGSGQSNYDRPESDPFRYLSSSGLDPWTRFHLSTLPATALSLTSAATNLRLAVAGGRLYVADGHVIRYTTDLTNWTAITGNPASDALSLASDGATLYVAYGADGLYTVASGAAAMTSYATGTVSRVGYAKGRLLVVETSGADPRVYNVVATGAVTAGTLLLTVPGGVFPANQWTAEGPNSAYIVCVVGDQSRLWRTSVKSDGTALDAPVKAGELPDGELVRSIQGYLGSVLFAGTDSKVWTFGFDGAGNLRQLGNFDTAAPVYGFEPQESFVWFGGAASATLGRMDLRTNVSPDPTTGFTPGGFTPGYANDLAAALTGDVQSVATFNDRRAFTVSGRGVYVQAATKVTSGTLDTGIISFGLADLKNVLFADVHFQPLGSGDKVTVEVSKDGGAYALAGIAMLPGSVSATVPLGQLLAETISLRLTVTGNATVTALTTRCVPAPEVGQIMRVPLLLWRDGKDIHGAPYTWDALFERNYLANLRRDRTAVAVQHGAEPLTAIVNRLTDWHEESKAMAADGSWTGQWNGTLTCDLLLVDG